MKLKLTVILTTLVVTLGLLLGASAASGEVPEPATLISPSGTITDNTPTYTWNAVADSTWYLLWVWDSTETKKLLQWYTAEEAGCSGGTGECSVTPETKLADDSHEWWIRTWNDDGYGNWSDELSILVAVSIPPAPVPRTGQTQSYAAGDDGDLQNGVPWLVPRFTDNDDGTVTDNLTGLIWLKNTNCFGRENWNDALDASNSLADGDCGLTDGSSAGDWRLPNVRELYSLIDNDNSYPALPSDHPFINMQSSYCWSSTTNASYLDVAWLVGMGSGSVYDDGSKGTTYYVWPVRGGKFFISK